MSQSMTPGPGRAALPPARERRRLRTAKGVTLTRLAAMLGVPRSTLRAWEKARVEPEGHERERYARLLARYATELRRAELRRVDLTRRATDTAPPRKDGRSPAARGVSAGSDGAPEVPRRPDRGPTHPDRDVRPSRVPPGTGLGRRQERKASEERQAAPEQRNGSGAPGSTAARRNGSRAQGTAAEQRNRSGAPGGAAPERRSGRGRDGGRTGEPSDRTSPVRRSEVPRGGPVRSGVPRRVQQPARQSVQEPTRHSVQEPTRRTRQRRLRRRVRAFDALYAAAAPGLVRQAYLLTGRHDLAHEAVRRAFQEAWHRWPEATKQGDLTGWVRATAHDYAVAPWHRYRRTLRGPDAALPEAVATTDTPPSPAGPDPERSGSRPPAPRRPDERPPRLPEDHRSLREALLALPPHNRRALLLYDGLGLSVHRIARETEASIPATAHRILHAREEVAARLPELDDACLLRIRLGALVAGVPTDAPSPAEDVRADGERRAGLVVRTVLAGTLLAAGITAVVALATPDHYEPPWTPDQPVTGVPHPGQPAPLTNADVVLRERLRHEPMHGPARLVPTPE